MLKWCVALTLSVVLLSSVEGQLSGELYQGCGDTKGCVGEAEACVEDQTCNYLLTYTKEQDAYSFQYTALVPEGEEYIATGLSLDGGSGSMSNDSVVACYAGEDIEQDMQDFVHMYWNVDHDSLPLEEERLGLSDASGEKIDDIITCSFIRDAVTTITNPEDNLDYIFDLNTQQYYVQFVRGPLDSGIVAFHEDYHAGEVLIDFTTYSADDGSTTSATYDGCFEVKGCFGTSEDCIESQSCTSYTTYTVNSDGSVSFIITGDEVAEDGYISFGLSETEEMFEAIVMYCFIGTDGLVELASCWTPESPDRDCIPLDEPLLGLNDFEGSYEGGTMTCSFTREQITQIPIPDTNEDTITIDLSMQFYLLAADGPMDEDSSDPLQIAQHSERFGSEESSFLDSYGSSDNTDHYNGCGTTKGCVGDVDGCVDDQDCSYLLTYTKIDGEEKFSFSLVVEVDTDDEYAAVGWSLDGGTDSMSDDSVVACYPGEDIEEDMEDYVHMYWNVYHDSFPLEEERLGITSASGTRQDSYITCDFVRDAVTIIPDPEDGSAHTIDLDGTPYFVLFARGELDDDSGFLDGHNDRVPGEKLIDFTSYDNNPDGGGSDDPLYDGCGESKGCVGWRNDTQECLSTQDCDYLVTYQGLSEDTYQFELRGIVVGESGNYVASGISTDRNMGQDSVTVCGVIDGEPRVELYWNNGKGKRTSIRLEDQSGLSNYNVILEDGVLTCTFSRDAVFSVEEDDVVYNFDLNRIPYYLLVALGDYDIELSPPLINYHGRDNHYVSPDSQLLSDYNDNVDQGESEFYDGCDSDKGCFGQPEGCISSRNCMLAMSYQGISGDEYTYEIIGVMEGGSDSWYVAMGLSSDGEMGDDNVVICKSTADPENSIQAYYNEGKSTPVKLDDPDYGIFDGSVDTINNLLYCSFNRPSSMVLEVGGEEVLEQDVNSISYYILMARGLLDNTGEPEQHGGDLEDRAPTDTEVALFAFNPSADDFYQGCNGNEKGCFGFPDGCVEQQNCEVAVSYTGNEDGTYDFALRGPLSEYLAVGFSSDNSMGDDSVVVCSYYEEAYRVQSYYNLPGEKYSEPLEDDTLGLSGQSTGSRQEYYQCTFTRDAYLEVPVPGTTDIVPYDLDLEEYYILLAYGNLESSTGYVLEHTGEDASSKPIYIGAYGPLGRAQEIYFGCGDTKGCYGIGSPNCLNTTDCQAVVTYQGVSETEYLFELQGIVPDRSYVAFGLSQDSEAGDDSVIACNNIGEITAYWYTGDHTTLKSSEQGFINATSTVQDGDVLYCSFILPEDFTLQTQSASPSSVALNSGAYSISLGQGNENNGNLQEPDERGISEQSFVFSEYNRFIGGGYDGCFEVKGCFGTSTGCVESRSCTSYTTYMVNSDGSVSFTIIGEGVTDSNYISFGLSETEGMPEAIVMYCFIGAEGVVQVASCWTPENPIRDCLPLIDPLLGINEFEGSYEDSIMTCSFTRDQITEVPIPSSGETVTVDLSLEFYMLAAVGPMDERNPDPIKIDQHEERASSAEPSPLNSYGSLEAPSNMHIKLHGSLMVIAWYLMASSGVFIARYGKQQFFGLKLFGKDLWFPIHQALMLSTWLLTLVAFLVMVIEYKFDPLMSMALDLNPHALIGLCATCFMFVQPFMAMMRCHPGHRFRFLFDYAHSLIGFTALILGAVAIYFATDETFYEKIPMPDAIRTVSLVHIGVLSGIHLILTAYLMYLRFLKKPKKDDTDGSEDKGAWEKERKRKNRPDPMIFACMVVYVLFNFSIATAMVVYIVKGDDEASV